MDPSPSPPEFEDHSGNGKIARLPDNLREQVNQMIFDGQPYRTIIESLGEHGKDIDEKNITTWRKNGGFEAWRQNRETKESLEKARSEALQLNQHKPATDIQDAGRAIASGQLFELIRQFDPSNFVQALADKPETYLRLVSVFSRVSEAEALCSHRRLQLIITQIKIEEAKAVDSKKMYSGQDLKQILERIRIL